MKCIKVQNLSGTKLINETLQDQLNESILFKRLENTALHKHYGVNQKKDCQPRKFWINKVCVVSLTNFLIFLN